MYKAKILLDSTSPNGNRLTTFELTYPRIVHSELLTHRMFSKNSASSRAIPIKKFRQQIIKNPFVPVWFGKNQKGMQAAEELTGVKYWLAKQVWLNARYIACGTSWIFEKIGLHKQVSNRILEPWMWITVILSSTTFENFFELRCHKDAQPEIKKIAEMMREEYNKSIPKTLKKGEWHLPLINKAEGILPQFSTTFREATLLERIKMSTGRCARVSYLTHDGVRNPEADLQLHDRLVASEPKHMSPTEHQAECMDDNNRYGNFVGFKQYRQYIERDETKWIQ